jgi:hypothetical protein
MELDGIEMEQRDGIGQALKALDAGEAVEAAAQFERLMAIGKKQGSPVLEPSSAWESLKRLLGKRGYFVATPGQVVKSLEEIRDVGEGFDLYDLVASMARYYRTVAGEAGLLGPLKQFAAPASR